MNIEKIKKELVDVQSSEKIIFLERFDPQTEKQFISMIKEICGINADVKKINSLFSAHHHAKNAMFGDEMKMADGILSQAVDDLEDEAEIVEFLHCIFVNLDTVHDIKTGRYQGRINPVIKKLKAENEPEAVACEGHRGENGFLIEITGASIMVQTRGYMERYKKFYNFYIPNDISYITISDHSLAITNLPLK